MESSWLELLLAGLTSGVTVKVVEVLWTELRKRRDDQRSAREVINRHLDPVLKAADELVGKLSSLAQEDFKDLVGSGDKDHGTVDGGIGLAYSVYLFAQFWSHLQILRAAALFTNLGAVQQGKWLLEFMSTLESTRARLVERARQRGIGEAIIEPSSQRPITFHEFFERFGQDELNAAFVGKDPENPRGRYAQR